MCHLLSYTRTDLRNLLSRHNTYVDNYVDHGSGRHPPRTVRIVGKREPLTSEDVTQSTTGDLK